MIPEPSSNLTAGENPFAPSRLERVLPFDPLLSGTTWEELEARWERLCHRGVICGRYGSGKSTLLRAWGRRLSERGEEPLELFFNRQRWDFLPEHRERVRDIGDRPLLVDGWDFLSLRERLFLMRRARRLLVTRHRGWGGVVIRLRPDARLAQELLLRAAPEHAAAFAPGLAEGLAHHRGNLREVWMDCYARLAGPGFVAGHHLVGGTDA